MDSDRKIREAMDAERNEIAFVIWSAVGGGGGGYADRTLFNHLNQPPGEHPTLLAAFHAADDLLRSVAVIKALFDVRFRQRLKAGHSTTAERLHITGFSHGDLVAALRQWGSEMDRSASELMSAGEISAGGGSATVAALMIEAAARLEKAVAHG